MAVESMQRSVHMRLGANSLRLGLLGLLACANCGGESFGVVECKDGPDGCSEAVGGSSDAGANSIGSAGEPNAGSAQTETGTAGAIGGSGSASAGAASTVGAGGSAGFAGSAATSGSAGVANTASSAGNTNTGSSTGNGSSGATAGAENTGGAPSAVGGADNVAAGDWGGSAGTNLSGGEAGAATTAGEQGAGGSDVTGTAGGNHGGAGGAVEPSCEARCAEPRECRNGACEGPSCAGLLGIECQGDGCCDTITVPAGTFYMGRGTEQCDGCVEGCPPDVTCLASSQPEHPATVDAFELDKFEVTVGRFEPFVAACGAGWRPGPGDGKHPQIAGSGWNSSWDAELDEIESEITCTGWPLNTWQESRGTFPMNCITWYHAFAFCIWDGGRLPTEAEWEYAATGGDENRLYPWGQEQPSHNNANWYGSASSPFADVGSYQGIDGQWNGRWGHSDLAGSLAEWTLDWYMADYYDATVEGCINCANNLVGVGRVLRGGNFAWLGEALMATARDELPPDNHYDKAGVRCARSVAE